MIKEIIASLLLLAVLSAECHVKPGEAHLNPSEIWN